MKLYNFKRFLVYSLLAGSSCLYGCSSLRECYEAYKPILKEDLKAFQSREATKESSRILRVIEEESFKPTREKD